MSEEGGKVACEPSCTNFTMDGDPDDWTPCRCPSCHAFLPRSFPMGKQFQCKRCGAVLETLPSPVEDLDEEEDSDMEFGGRICVVPSVAVKILVVQYPRPRKPRGHRRKKTERWAMGVNFSRRVWVDKGGEFITMPERVALDDSRILKIVGEK